MIIAQRTPRLLRLLPSVVVVGAGLLVLNASGLVHDAYAGIDQPAAERRDGARQPPTKDFAGDDAQVASASEVDVLTSLSKRRGELDAREAQIQIAGQYPGRHRSARGCQDRPAESLQSQITALLAQRDAAQEKQVAALVKTYSAMKPKEAGPHLRQLERRGAGAGGRRK